MSTLIINEHKSKAYPPRTFYNVALADLTLAFVVNSLTAGEKLTAKAAGASYVAVWYYASITDAVDSILDMCLRNNVKVLNVAGNGIYTFAEFGITQTQVNKKLYDILTVVQGKHPISRIVSGGQTGTDIAGAVVAEVLGIDCEMTYPKGFRMRNANNEEIYSTENEIREMVAAQAYYLREQLNWKEY